MFRLTVVNCPECNEQLATMIENIALERIGEFSEPTVKHGAATAPEEEHSHGAYRHKHPEPHGHLITLTVEYLNKQTNKLEIGERTFAA